MFRARVSRRWYTSETARTLILSPSLRLTSELRWPVPMPPQPITAKLIRSLAPLTPEEARRGIARALAARVEVLMNARRELDGIFIVRSFVRLGDQRALNN